MDVIAQAAAVARAAEWRRLMSERMWWVAALVAAVVLAGLAVLLWERRYGPAVATPAARQVPVEGEEAPEYGQADQGA